MRTSDFCKEHLKLTARSLSLPSNILARKPSLVPRHFKSLSTVSERRDWAALLRRLTLPSLHVSLLKQALQMMAWSRGAVCLLREKLKVPPRPFPLKEQSHYKHSGQLQVFFTQLEPNVHGVRQSSHVSVETNSNKRISVLGTNHTKIYRVNLVGFKHSAEDPSRSPQKQNKYTLRSKRFSNVLTNHQGRFPTTLKPFPKQNNSLTEVLLTSD